MQKRLAVQRGEAGVEEATVADRDEFDEMAEAWLTERVDPYGDVARDEGPKFAALLRDVAARAEQRGATRERSVYAERNRLAALAGPPRDWPAVWSSLSPREAWEALRSAPKVAGAWTDGPFEGEHRVDAFGRAPVWSVHQRETMAIVGYHTVSSSTTTYPDRASADAALRAAGWVLVDEEDRDAAP